MKVCRNSDVNASKKLRRDRLEVAQKVVNIKNYLEKTGSQTKAALSENVPRTTLQYWIKCDEIKTGLPQEVENFFKSPIGMAYLHRLVMAAQFSITQLGSAGIEVWREFLHLSQLDHFVASSHGTLHAQSVAMETAINQFGQEENERLASQMPKKKISVCQDETFHPEICLVAIEPVSNFILLEEYSEKRDATAWSDAMKPVLNKFSIEIIQSISDEGSGLVKYVEKELGVHHSSDLFHGQQEITRATSAQLNAKVRQAEARHKENNEKLIRAESKLVTHLAKPSSKSVCDHWQKKIEQIQRDITQTSNTLETVKLHQEQVKTAKKALGTAYHPYDLNTGKAQTTKEISEKITQQLAIIEATATESKLSDNSMKYLEKAKRTFTHMFTTITFFWSMVNELIASLCVFPEVESLMRDILIPGLYLEIAAKKAKGAAERKRIAVLAKTTLARLDLYSVWIRMPAEQRLRINAVALQCAQLFQRSSSCVEGRNGYLSLRHHSSHCLSKRKLGVLTVIHNYFIKRPDNTTAAERFFQAKPKDLFEFLLNNLGIPARPAKSRRALKMAA